MSVYRRMRLPVQKDAVGQEYGTYSGSSCERDKPGVCTTTRPPAGHNMGMSVALDGDARQAAAMKLAEEQALVRRAQAGDRLAFEELVHRYDREVLRLALNLVHRAEDARDIYQESFMRVYKNLHRFRFECSFYTWLYRIVTNVALDHLRRRTSRREDQAPVPEEAEGGNARLLRPAAGNESGRKSGTKSSRPGTGPAHIRPR